MRARRFPRRIAVGASLLAMLAGVGGCGATHRPAAARAQLEACVRLWNRDDARRHKEELAIVVQGALPDTGVFVTTHAPRGEAGELGTSPTVQIGPGRCVIGEQRNTLFVYAGRTWHIVNPTDSSDPALNVVYGADDNPNAEASDGQGDIALR